MVAKVGCMVQMWQELVAVEVGKVEVDRWFTLVTDG